MTDALTHITFDIKSHLPTYEQYSRAKQTLAGEFHVSGRKFKSIYDEFCNRFNEASAPQHSLGKDLSVVHITNFLYRVLLRSVWTGKIAGPYDHAIGYGYLNNLNPSILVSLIGQYPVLCKALLAEVKTLCAELGTLDCRLVGAKLMEDGLRLLYEGNPQEVHEALGVDFWHYFGYSIHPCIGVVIEPQRVYLYNTKREPFEWSIPPRTARKRHLLVIDRLRKLRLLYED